MPSREEETTNSIFEGRLELLDKLIELPLRGFPEIDATPTSGVTSLPIATPLGDGHSPLGGDDHHVDVEPHHEAPIPLLCPPAPHIKDLDSFTDGTGGSFDFSLNDEECLFGHPQPPPLNSSSLSHLPPQESISIELWREDVYFNSPTSEEPPAALDSTVEDDYDDEDAIIVDGDADDIDGGMLSDASVPSSALSSAQHSKRPRSITSDDSDGANGAKRIRPRAQSAYASPYSLVAQFYGSVEPPLADVRPLVRPQLRRTRSLPLRPD